MRTWKQYQAVATACGLIAEKYGRKYEITVNAKHGEETLICKNLTEVAQAIDELSLLVPEEKL